MITYAKITMISPTIAATIVERAVSIFPLSPPERIHLTPPYKRKIRDRTIPITIIAFMINAISSFGDTLIPPIDVGDSIFIGAIV